MTDQNVNLLIGLLGIMKSGNGFVPIDPRHPRERIEFVISDCVVETLVTEEKWKEKACQLLQGCSTIKRIIYIDEFIKKAKAGKEIELSPQSNSYQGNRAEGNNGAALDRSLYVIYTSGSTGVPKGVPITHSNLIPLLLWSKECFGLSEKTRVLQNLSQCFDFGVFEILTTLLFGGTLYILDKYEAGSPSDYAGFIMRQSINTIHTTPSTYRNMLSGVGRRLETLEILHLGGEQLTESALKQVFKSAGEGCVLYNGYGPTETSVNATIFKVGNAAEYKVANDYGGSVPIGAPSANNRIYVLDKHLRLVPFGIPGELHVGGPGLSPGYLNRPDLTADKFIPNPFSSDPGARLYKTGDIVQDLQNGGVEFLGRVDNQVKMRGFRIEVGEIESVVSTHPCVREAVVTIREDGFGSKYLAAYVVSAQPQPTVGELRRFLKEKLPEYMIPSSFMIVEKLPLTPSGKVDRGALPELPTSRSDMEEVFVAPRTLEEEMVADICADALGLGRIGVDDDLFNLGCHSLLATGIITRLREAFQVEIPLMAIFQEPTVAGLVRSIDAFRQAGKGIQTPPLVPIRRGGHFPLSFAQERIWFLSQLDPTSASYYIPRAIRVSGPFDVGVVEQTFTEITRRHEILRTTFPEMNGRPVQVIHPPDRFTAPLVDLRRLDVTEREREIERLIIKSGRQRFDLEKGPFIRVTALQSGDQEFILIMTEHHLIHDGWTQGVLIRDFLTIYAAFVAGEQSPLDELTIQYADYAYWQREYLQGATLDLQLAYWKRQFDHFPPPLELPADRHRPPAPSSLGRELTLTLDNRLAEELRAFSRREGVTFFMTMLAAFKTLLYRYTRRQDLVVGTGIANRRWREIEGLLGMVINTLALRTDLSGAPTFRELLRRVQQTCLGAYAHQDLPFEKLVEELQPERSLSYTPIFQTLFAFMDVPHPDLHLPGVDISVMEAHNRSAKFDLNVVAIHRSERQVGASPDRRPREVVLSIEYNTDIFDAATIERLGQHYINLLSAATENADQPISRMALLTEAERKQVLVKWNETERYYARDKGIHELFEDQVRRAPSAVAVVFEETMITYEELDRRANRLAHYLRALGAGPDARVGVYLERSVELVVALLGILKSGGAYVPLDVSYPAERLIYMVEDAEVEALLTQQRLKDRLPDDMIKSICLDTEWEKIASYSSDNPYNQTDPENLAYIIYTSGSTGAPKGIAVIHKGVTRLVQAIDYIEPTSQDRFLQFAPISFDASTFEIWGSLLNGASLVEFPPHLPSTEELEHSLSKHNITTLWLTAGLFQQMAERQAAALRKIKNLLAGGDVLSRHHVRKILELPGTSRLINGYGPTENTTFTCCYSMYTADDAGEGSIPLGGPIANTQIYILDSHLQPIPIGVAGDIYIGGDGLARGYLKMPELTAEKFIPNPFGRQAGERMYGTGDLGKWLREGRVEFLGRSDNQVKIRGYRIEVGEIEAVLNEYHGVKESAVIAWDYGLSDKRLVAYIVGRQPWQVLTSELRRRLKDKLPEYMIPSAFVSMDALPLTVNGKVDRQALPAPEWGENSADDSITAHTPIEEALIGIWRQVLGLTQVSLKDNFFEIGGHSLLAIQLVSRIRETFKVELTMRSVFGAPVLTDLAQHIEQAIRHQTGLTSPAIERSPREGNIPLSFAQRRLWFLDQLDPGSSLYNIPAVVKVVGGLNAPTLEQALTSIVKRHEALRTSYTAIEGQPVQVIEEPQPLAPPMIDLTGLQKKDREVVEKRLADEEAARAFDLSKGLMLRVALLRESPEEHVALLAAHHIASDGWSIEVLVREVAEFYEAYVEGRPDSLKDLPVQYADYAIWQRNWLQGDVLETELEYWRRQMSEAPVLLELPADRPRPVAQTYKGSRLSFTVSEELTRELVQMSQAEGASLFMTLVAVFHILLHRYTGQKDILVGTPIAGRNRAEIEGLIGLFVNMLVIRGDLSGNLKVSQLLRRIKETVLGAYAHQDLPFEKLVEELQPERSLSYNPIFQTVFAFMDMPRHELQLPGINISVMGAHNKLAKFDLNIIATPHRNWQRGASHPPQLSGITLSVEYNTDIFDVTTIERVGRHYINLLEAAAADREHLISQMALMSEVERRQILMEWNETKEQYDGGGESIQHLFEKQAGSRPEAIAISCGEEELSYGELNRIANRLAHYLRRRGVGPGAIALIHMRRSVEAVVGMLGVLKAGGAYAPVEDGAPTKRVKMILEETGAEVLLTERALARRLDGSRAETILIDGVWSGMEAESEETPVCMSDPEVLAYLIYTSGSTGRPKGSQLTHRGLVNLVNWHRRAFKVDAKDRASQLAAISFDASIWEIWSYLAFGASIHIADEETRVMPERLRDWIIAKNITIAFLPTPLAESAFSLQWSADIPIRTVLTGGDKLHRYPPASVSFEVVNNYGPTESAVVATSVTLLGEKFGAIPPIGRPIANTEIYVLDDYLEPLPIGVAGELHISGAGLARGYLNQPGLTAERFIPNPFGDHPGSRLYRTGDISRYLAEGNIEFIGRKDNQVKIRGYRIEMGEIEAVLNQHQALQDVAVMAHQDARGDKNLCAYVVPKPEFNLTPNDLRAYLLDRLPSYMVPSAFVTLESMPLTPNGKLDRRRLPAPRQTPPRDLTPPGTATEEILTGVWSEVLSIDQVGVHDNFFELGGHSLLATQLVSKVRKSFQTDISLESVFKSPTIYELAQVIENLKDGAKPSPPKLAALPRENFIVPKAELHR